MRIRWTAAAAEDLRRLYEFMARADPVAAVRTARLLQAAPGRLLDQPRRGARLDQYSPREVRRWFVGMYEMRYEIRTDTLIVLNFWHVREDR